MSKATRPVEILIDGQIGTVIEVGHFDNIFQRAAFSKTVVDIETKV